MDRYVSIMKFYGCCEDSLVMIIIRLDLPRDGCESSRFFQGKEWVLKEQAEILPAFLRNCQGATYTVQKKRLRYRLWGLFWSLPNPFHSGCGFAVVSLWWIRRVVFLVSVLLCSSGLACQKSFRGGRHSVCCVVTADDPYRAFGVFCLLSVWGGLTLLLMIHFLWLNFWT